MTVVIIVLLATMILAIPVAFILVRATRRKMKGVSCPHKRPKGLPAVKETCEVIPESDERVQYQCSHSGWKAFRVSFWGEEIAPAPEFIEKREKCPDCMLEEALRVTIRCALCGFIIGPGDHVALYHDDGSFKTEWVSRHGEAAIGCMRWDCCPSGGFHAGKWDGKQFVPAYEHGSAAAQALATGEVVIANLD